MCPWRALPEVSAHGGRYIRGGGCGVRKASGPRARKVLSCKLQGVLKFIDACHLKVHQDAHGGRGGKELQAIGHARRVANRKPQAIGEGKSILVKAVLTAGQISDVKIDPEL